MYLYNSSSFFPIILLLKTVKSLPKFIIAEVTALTEFFGLDLTFIFF